MENRWMITGILRKPPSELILYDISVYFNFAATGTYFVVYTTYKPVIADRLTRGHAGWLRMVAILRDVHPEAPSAVQGRGLVWSSRGRLAQTCYIIHSHHHWKWLSIYVCIYIYIIYTHTLDWPVKNGDFLYLCHVMSVYQTLIHPSFPYIYIYIIRRLATVTVPCSGFSDKQCEMSSWRISVIATSSNIGIYGYDPDPRDDIFYMHIDLFFKIKPSIDEKCGIPNDQTHHLESPIMATLPRPTGFEVTPKGGSAIKMRV